MTESTTYSDLAFLEGIRKSDLLIENAFYRQHYSMVRGLLNKRDSLHQITLDDHYQDVMAIVFTNIKDGKLTQLTSKLSTYVYSIADKLLLYKLREGKKMTTTSMEEYGDPAVDSEGINLDVLELTALEMVKKLKPPCNEIIIDWYIHQLSYEQIAEKHKYKNANTAKKKKGDCMTEARVNAKQLLASNNNI